MSDQFEYCPLITDDELSNWLNELAGRNVLVTGAGGFIGSHLTRRLVAKGAHVSALTLTELDRRSLADVLGQVSLYAVDIGDADAVRQALGHIRPEIVFHLAAVGTSGPSITVPAAWRVNVEGTRNLLEAACRSGVRRFVHTGTAYEYGQASGYDLSTSKKLDPLAIYAASKMASHALVQEYGRTQGLPVVSLRLFAVYGPGQSAKSLMPAAVDAALEGRDFPMTAGEQLRDFVFVHDVVEGYLYAAAVEGIEGSITDLGTGNALTVREAVSRVFRLVGSPARLLAGALPYRPGEMMVQVADPRPARELLGWQATISLEDGLRQTIEWYRQAKPVLNTLPVIHR